jgi:hypothetical protein
MSSQVYILSCGADDGNSRGVSLWWKGNKLNLRVRTATKEWKVKARFSRSEARFLDFVNVEFSWNVETGLDLYINGELEESDRKYKRKSYRDTPDSCLVGKRRGRGDFFNFILSDLYIVYAPRRMVVDLEIPFGMFPVFACVCVLYVGTVNMPSRVKIVKSFIN